MAKKLTSRKPLFGNLRSHSCRATKTRQNLNLQVHRLEDGTKVRISTKEKRTLLKNDKTA